MNGHSHALHAILVTMLKEIRALREDIRNVTKTTQTNGSLQQVLKELEKQTEILLKIKGPIFEPKPGHWYETGVITAPNVPSDKNAKDYDFHNFINALGYPAMEGSILNFGPGNLFVRFARSPANISRKETKIPANASLEWTTDDRYAIYYLYIRADAADTTYQIIAG